MWYDAGTVSVEQGSNAVIGLDTRFIANVRVGDALKGPDGAWYEIINVASNTAMAIKPNYAGPTVAGAAYSVTPVQGYNKMLSDAVRSIAEDSAAAIEGATASAAAALVSETNAKTSETNAKSSETKAKTSETNAKTSETNAKTSETNAAASAIAAKTSETNSKTSETNAKTSETNAATSAAQVANKANKGANSDITSLSGLTTALSLLQGGTGQSVSNSASLIAALGAMPAGGGNGYAPNFNYIRLLQQGGYGAGQGGYIGWNETNGNPLSSGAMSFTCNRGGGLGGFSWRSVNADNTVGGPFMTYSFDGLLTVPTLQVTNPASLVTQLKSAGLYDKAAALASLSAGGIMERGSNANGEYARFGDGTMICVFAYDASAMAITAQIGSIFQAGQEATWTFPAQFSNIPFVAPMVSRNDGAVILGTMLRTIDPAKVLWRLWSATAFAAGNVKDMKFLAIGRWN